MASSVIARWRFRCGGLPTWKRYTPQAAVESVGSTEHHRKRNKMTQPAKEPAGVSRFLYPHCLKEEQFHLDEHQKRISFFAGLVSAVFAATVAGTLNASEAHEYLLLIAGPFLIVALSIFASQATRRFYNRFLETVAQRAKLEHDLGMYDHRHGDSWVQQEALVPTRHQQSRLFKRPFPTAQGMRPADYGTSQAFVDGHIAGGYQGVANKLFAAFLFAGSAVGLVLLYLAWAEW